MTTTKRQYKYTSRRGTEYAATLEYVESSNQYAVGVLVADEQMHQLEFFDTRQEADDRYEVYVERLHSIDDSRGDEK
jgi:hypothetical protein